jgi:L-threonylcarbamoyladenylate synthase
MTAIEAEFPTVLTLLERDRQPIAGEKKPLVAPSGIPSTVIRWHGTGWEILRQGSMTLDL